MRIGRDLLVGSFVFETIRLLPMILSFSISLFLLNCKHAVVQPIEISYQSSGFIDFYMSNEMVSFHCADIKLSLKQSTDISKSYVETKGCNFTIALPNGGIRTQSPWTQSLIDSKITSNTDVYPYLKQHGFELKDTSIVLQIPNGNAQIERNCIVTEWYRIEFADKHKEIGIKAFCPRIMTFTGLPIPLDTAPAYVNPNNEYYSRQLVWPENIATVSALFTTTTNKVNHPE